MIREATVEDAARTAEIDVTSSRYEYKDILSDEILYNELTLESRIPVHQRWISEKRFEMYAFELHFLYVDPDHQS